jgi:hypothetical protein
MVTPIRKRPGSISAKHRSAAKRRQMEKKRLALLAESQRVNDLKVLFVRTVARLKPKVWRELRTQCVVGCPAVPQEEIRAHADADVLGLLKRFEDGTHADVRGVLQQWAVLGIPREEGIQAVCDSHRTKQFRLYEREATAETLKTFNDAFDSWATKFHLTATSVRGAWLRQFAWSLRSCRSLPRILTSRFTCQDCKSGSHGPGVHWRLALYRPPRKRRAAALATKQRLNGMDSAGGWPRGDEARGLQTDEPASVPYRIPREAAIGVEAFVRQRVMGERWSDIEDQFAQASRRKTKSAIREHSNRVARTLGFPVRRRGHQQPNKE